MTQVDTHGKEEKSMHGALHAFWTHQCNQCKGVLEDMECCMLQMLGKCISLVQFGFLCALLESWADGSVREAVVLACMCKRNTSV